MQDTTNRRPRRSTAWPRASRRDARLLRSARLVGSGRTRRALAGYLGLVAETPDCLAAKNRAGDLLAQSGQIARAIELFEVVADAWDDAGFNAKAAAVRRKIVRWAPSHRAARAALASWLRSVGREADAVAIEDAAARGSERYSHS